MQLKLGKGHANGAAASGAPVPWTQRWTRTGRIIRAGARTSTEDVSCTRTKGQLHKAEGDSCLSNPFTPA